MTAPGSPLVAREKVERLLQSRRPAEAEAHARRALTSDPEDAELLCLLARAQTAQDRSKDAVATLEAAVAAEPEWAYPWVLYSHALTMDLRHADAFDAAREAVALDPEYSDGQLRLSRAAKQVGERDVAFRAADRALELAPSSPRPWENLGWLAAGERQWSKAEAAYRRALELAPDEARWLCKHADVLQHLGRRDEAVERYRRAVTADPRWVDAVLGLVSALETADELPEAMQVVERAAQAFPKSVDVQLERVRLTSHLNPEVAVDLAREVTKRFPNEGSAWCRLAWCLREVEKPDEALAAARRAVEVQPGLRWAHDSIASLLFANGQTAEGLEYAMANTEREPRVAYFWRRLASHAASRAPDVARRALATLEELAPHDPMGWHHAAALHLFLNDVPSARRALRRLAEVAPEDWSTWEQHAWVALHLEDDRGKVHEAIARAREHCHDQRWRIQLDGWDALCDQRWEDARQKFELCMERGFSTCEVVSFYAVCLAHLGDEDEARRIHAGGRVGRGQGRRCTNACCPNATMLAAALSGGTVTPTDSTEGTRRECTT